MSMRKFWMAVVAWALLSMGNLSFAAEPVVQPQPKASGAAPVTQLATKHAAAKPPVAKQALVKPKPTAPKYYYVRGSSLPALPALPAAATPVPALQMPAAAPEVGDVHIGRMVCELGNSVTVTPDPQQATQFIVQMKKNTFHMTPVETSTGAVRLEDTQAGAMWLQLPHKSMLMNSKLGQRMADECQSEHQSTVAQSMKLNPPPNLLDGPTFAKK
jgi:hypothetical protein